MQNLLNRNRFILLLIIFSALLSSCVTKKKYLEMEAYKNRAEERILVLTKNVADLKEEFDAYSYKFQYNNSEKDLLIDSLSGVIVDLNSDLSSKAENIEDQIFSFQVEKRRLNQLLAEKDREIRQLQRSSETMKISFDDLQNEIADLKIDIRNAESSSASVQRQVDQKQRDIDRLNGQLEKQTAQMADLRKQISAKEDEIKVLQNQVKVYKNQFGQTQ